MERIKARISWNKFLFYDSGNELKQNLEQLNVKIEGDYEGSEATAMNGI